MKTQIILSGVVVAIIAGTTIKLFSNKSLVADGVYHRDGDMKILVQVDSVRNDNFQKSFTYTGTFTPIKEVFIVPQVHGEVTNVTFKEGDVVSQNQQLVQVDDDLLQAQLTAAETSYQTAKRNLERYQLASSSGGVSQLQLDNLNLNFRNAEAQLKQLTKQISLSKLKAPFTGTVTFKDVEVGSVVGNSAIARITDLSQMKLEISVPEKEVGMFHEGDEVLVDTDVYPTKSFKGVVCFVADRADNAHNYTIKIAVTNEDSSARLKAGMYGVASVSKTLNNGALLIPRSALLGSAKNPQVFVIDDDTAGLKTIQTGTTNEDFIEVTMGLSAGEIVVTGGQINLTDGVKVAIAN